MAINYETETVSARTIRVERNTIAHKANDFIRCSIDPKKQEIHQHKKKMEHAEWELTQAQSKLADMLAQQAELEKAYQTLSGNNLDKYQEY